jgi:hypothetical protein
VPIIEESIGCVKKWWCGAAGWVPWAAFFSGIDDYYCGLSQQKVYQDETGIVHSGSLQQTGRISCGNIQIK